MNNNFRFDPVEHKYYLGDRRITGITEAMERTGLTPKIPEAAKKNFAYAAERGTAIHKMCELHDLGKADQFDMDPNLQGYLDAWKKFCWDYGFGALLTEVPMYHPVYQFGGTPDVAGYSDKLKCKVIVERKAVREISDTVGFQLAGQDLLVKANHEGFEFTKTLVVQLMDDSKYRAKEYGPGMYKNLFLSAVSIANYQISKERT